MSETYFSRKYLARNRIETQKRIEMNILDQSESFAITIEPNLTTIDSADIALSKKVNFDPIFNFDPFFRPKSRYS